MMFDHELQKQKALFAAVDAIALFSAFFTALALHDPSASMEGRLLRLSPLVLLAGACVIVAVWILVFRACDLYRMRNGGLQETLGVVKACAIAVLLTLLAGFLAHTEEVSRIAVALGFVLSIPFVIVARSLARALLRRVYCNPNIAIPLVVVGFNPLGHYLFDQIADEMTPYEPVGFLDDGLEGRQYRGYPVAGNLERLEKLANVYSGLEAAIALPESSSELQDRVIRACETNHVRWWLAPWISQSMAGGLRVDRLGMVPLIGPRGSNIEGMNYALKRAFDFVAASIILLIAAPVLAVGAAAVWFFDGGPVVFRQARVGIHGRTFHMFKLRTMRSAASDAPHRDYVARWIRDNQAAAHNGNGNGDACFKLTNDARITRVGRILRRFSVDELPQLVNVIRGEMSLIGPRPALPYELELYGQWHRRRLEVNPGITGLWQVSGRNHLSFDEMVRLDVQYLEDWSFGQDLRILARTLPALLRGGGV
ncbi:MAG: sugar transferase [Candidatus Binataceae bacterium]